MSRLADYFVVVGYDYNKERSGHGVGKIIQRFPEKDWDNCPFTQGIEQFCQPAGWHLTSQKQEPTFFVSALTDIDADRHYCACLTFSEDAAIEPLKEGDECMEQDLALIRCSKVYAPKSLVLISRLDYFETFRNCLGIIYAVHIENMQVSLETLIGNILGCIPVPPPGDPQIRFSIGAGDRQALQPPLSSGLPVTRSAVAQLFEQLGIANCLTIFCAALSDHKVLFHSSSYTRLTESGHALTALMYPLKYSYVYIPLLPIGLLEVLSTPTPFIAGVHTSLKPDAADLLDVVVADLDGGSIKLPENVHISLMPEPMLSSMLKSLQLILRPELTQADLAFPSSPPKLPDAEMLDKEIRAVFLRLFAELFFGYRSCLTIIRIHPEPVITFHKANFLGHRGLIEDDFTTRVLDSMSFNTFVVERGKPYRVCDIFDEVFATMQEVLKTEDNSTEKTLRNIRDLAQKLYQNENPKVQAYSQKIPRPTEGAHLRVHQPLFPLIDPTKVAEIIEEGAKRQSNKANRTSPVWQFPKIVPIGSHISAAHDKEHLVSTNARRLEVLRNCVNFIFENRISDARKIFPAVLRTLKNKVARLALVEELSYNVRSNNRALLEHQQFDLVIRLLNSALQNDSVMDEYGIAAAILPLATALCRKLYTGVIQFAYTCVQEHSVWASQQFWETAFYLDVQQQIRQLYLPQYESYPSSPKEGKDSSEDASWTRDTPQRSDSKRWSTSQNASGVRTRGISALEIAAEQLRVWQTLTTEQQTEMISNEESTVYSQAIHYANRIVYMRIPLDATKKVREPVSGMEGESLSSMVTNSVAESDSFDAESGFEDQEVNEVGTTVTKFVTRFIDKVCCESGVTTDHIKSLHQIVPGIVAMHLETLDAVHQESKRLPPIQKPKIQKPTLLPGEELVVEGLRSYLLPDGREEGTGGTIGGPVLLPAEGAIFLSNYRLIFRGAPCDPLACEQPVCRSFPISTLTKEKKTSAQYVTHIDQWLQEATQLRSSSFQLMKIAFDVEVSSDEVETLKKMLMRLRSPEHITMTFAFTGGYISAQQLPIRKAKEKNASLKSIAKQTLLKTARKAGLKPKEPKKRQKFIVPTPLMGRKLPIAGGEQFGMLGAEGMPVFGDDLSVIDEQEVYEQIQSDARNVDRLAERSYCKDYARLGLGSLSASQSRSRTDAFRLTMINMDFSVCQSYPSILVVPNSISDDSLQKFARTHRQNRFPVVTWRHPVTKAVLVRASGFHGKGLIGMFKGHYNTSAVTPGVDSATSVTLEQEKYFASLVAATPMGNQYYAADSLSSLDSFVLRCPAPGTSVGRPVLARLTPVGPRRNPMAFLASSFRGSAEKAMSLGRAGSLYDQRRPGSASVPAHHGVDSPVMSKPNGSAVDTRGLGDFGGSQGLYKAALYVLGEKTQLKGIRLESFKKCDFIPVDYVEVRQVKSSFKKLLRACVPSTAFTDPEKGFLRAIQDSEWLNQIQNILQISGAVIDLLDVQGSSVMVCLEDGWDFSTQVTSIAQILLDPFYRTFEGFRVLIEKEWLAFGHRFSHRSCQTTASQASGFAPIFLQFLDVVHQIHHQFPMSFEFNQYYLKFLAYHHVSNRFRTFMMDSELRRMEAGWLLDENKARMDLGGIDCDTLTSSHRVITGVSVWDYVDQCRNKSPIFFNFLFVPHDHETVLRPFSNISNLKLWSYYVMEDLAHGSMFDFELLDEMRQDDESDIVDLPLTFGSRRIVNSCYDDIMQVVPDSFTYLLQEIHRLEMETGGSSPRGWVQIWDRLEVPPMERLRVGQPFQTDRSDLSRSTHKRSTIELLVRSKMLGEATKMFSQPHHFVQFNYTTPAYCDHCSHILWGLIKTGMHCPDCGYNCHEKCVAHVPKNCTKIKPVSDLGNSSTSVSGGNVSDTASTTTGAAEKEVESYPEFVSSAAENRTHEGYLHKRGTLLKGWKQRWFVLDSMKHQLRYYDTQDDNNCKGYVDLKDVIYVMTIKNVQGAPKKADENAFFEVKTVRRVYQFLALDSRAAQEWIDRIQLCL